MSGRRLLVVEDEPALQKVLAMRLGMEGFEVETASDGQEALEIIRRNPPDMVLTDLMMPVMDGTELTRTIKRDPALKGIPVMVLTALKEQRERETLISLGADAFASKPYNSAELTAKIRELLD
ncbi:MAG: response regulator [Candidatus Dormibacteria bacterium]